MGGCLSNECKATQYAVPKGSEELPLKGAGPEALQKRVAAPPVAAPDVRVFQTMSAAGPSSTTPAVESASRALQALSSSKEACPDSPPFRESPVDTVGALNEFKKNATANGSCSRKCNRPRSTMALLKSTSLMDAAGPSNGAEVKTSVAAAEQGMDQNRARQSAQSFGVLRQTIIYDMVKSQPMQFNR